MTFYSNPKRDYVLNPRGKALYDDSNRFGTKMLEKMGWSKGKGLGANLDGQLDFIKVSHKGDQKGVGFKDRDDQWTTHESNFNSLLNSFKSVENSDEESQDCAVQHFRSDDKNPKKENADKKEELFSGVSLEEQSKNSRARVHYKKFTRGKDLARYSEKDLANIFGKKSLKCNAEDEGSTGESNEDEKLNKSSENTPKFGITTIETGTTINDYFKNKMKNAKTSSGEQVNSVESESVSGTKKEKKNRKKSKVTELASQDPTSDQNLEIWKETAVAVHSEQTSVNGSEKRKHDSDNVEETKSSKKKKKKSIEQAAETIDDETFSASKKSKKNKKEKLLDSTEGADVVQTDEPRKSKKEANHEVVSEIVNVEENHRAKKRKNKNANGVEDSQLNRKNKSTDETIAGSDNNSDSANNEKVRPHKKSKREAESGNDESTSGQDSTNLFDYVASIPDEKEENLSEVITDNIYEIRRYRTEIFRYVDLEAFPGSTLKDIPGYGYTSEMTLKVVDKGDENRLINTMWNDAQDKYATNSKKKKKKFVEHIVDLKKKNIFKL